MASKIRYKVLSLGERDEIRSPYQDYCYEPGRWYDCDDLGQPGENGCVRGLYAVPMEGLLYRGVWRGDERVFRCEVAGRSIDSGFGKQAWERLRIIEPLTEAQVRSRARRQHKRLGWLLEEVLYPIHPLKVERDVPPTEAEIALLREWASVWASVGDSVWDSVGASAWDPVGVSVRDSVWASVGVSVWASVGDSVWDSVGASVWASVGAYIGSLFPCAWPDGYPYQCGSDLWRAGLVPSYDGERWRLHAGPSAEIVWEE